MIRFFKHTYTHTYSTNLWLYTCSHVSVTGKLSVINKLIYFLKFLYKNFTYFIIL